MRALKIFIICILTVCASGASAQFLGQMSPASVLDVSTGKTGGYLIVAEDATAVVGSIRYGLSEFVEGRARLGLIDPEGGDMSFILGADFKYLLWSTKDPKNPVDLSLGAFLEYADLDMTSVLGAGGSVIVSYPFLLKNNRKIEPYGRFNLRIQRVSTDDFTYSTGTGTATVKGGSSSDLKLGLNAGALFQVTDLVDFTAEIQIDDQTAFLIGIDLAAF